MSTNLLMGFRDQTRHVFSPHGASDGQQLFAHFDVSSSSSSEWSIHESLFDAFITFNGRFTVYSTGSSGDRVPHKQVGDIATRTPRPSALLSRQAGGILLADSMAEKSTISEMSFP